MQAVRARLAALGVSQHALARALGISQATVSLWLNGYRTPRPGFEAAAMAELDLMEQVERAAADLRTHLLAEGRVHRAGDWYARPQRLGHGRTSERTAADMRMKGPGR